MANITKEKRDRLLSFLKKMKEKNKDDSSIIAINELENFLMNKKFGLVFEEHTEEVDEKIKKEIPVFCADETRKICKDKNLPYNFIIEGDNLQALYLLEKTHRGRIDCIYIDPPYNTGARDWKYNNDYVEKTDNYRHSKWLSMMKTRLLVAKKLLNPKNSVLICTIDEKEYLHLGCLLEELFPEGNIQMISSVINRHGSIRFTEFTRVNEYIFFIRFGSAAVGKKSVEKTNEPIHWHSLKRSGTSRGNFRYGRPFLFYPIYINEKTNKVVEFGSPLPLDTDKNSVPKKKNCITVFPIRKDGSEGCWSLQPNKAKELLSKGYFKVGKYNPNGLQKYELNYLQSGTVKSIENGEVIIDGYNEDGSVVAHFASQKTIMEVNQWNYTSHDASEYGTKMVTSMLGNRFSYPKSLYAVYDCLKYAVADNKDAIILDFFAGSGTTLHAVNLLNAEDGGNRTCIMITNNEISEEEERRLKAKNFSKGDEEWENLGVAKYVTYPRTKCSIDGKDIKGNILNGDYLVNDVNDNPIPMSSGFKSNVKYFKCDWTQRKPEDYLLSNVLCLHIKEMIELEHAIEVDNEENVIIFNKDDYKKYILDSEKYKKIKRLWVNQNIIFNSKEIKKLNNKGFKYIPKEYFGQELKEAAE